MTCDKVQCVWRERLQRCQRRLKDKEDEMGRQCQYFDQFKRQLHHKLSLARDREETLQKRIYTLEKQLLDMTVSAATDVAALSAVRIVPRLTETHWQEPGAREECEGEEEKNEGRRRQWQPNNGGERDGKKEGDNGTAENEKRTDTKLNSNEVRLQGFIVTLQEDLRVLLEREESGLAEHRKLIEQLQEAQESSLFLCYKVEEMKVELQQLNLSESALMKEVEELKVENNKLKHDLKDSTKQTPSQSSAISADVCSAASDTITVVRRPEGSSEMVLGLHNAVSAVHHQAAAATSNSATQAPTITAKHEPPYASKNDSLSVFPHLSRQTLNLASETKEEWGSQGGFNVEDTHSEESEALREAYRSLGLGEDLEGLREQCEHLEAALQQSKQQLQVMAQENAQLKRQLSNQREENQFGARLTSHEADAIQSSPVQEDVTDRDGLLHALNQENRALAIRIEELMTHIELNEEEMKSERSQLRANILYLEEDKAKLEQVKQEHGCLITELTRKTEDDLNTIMDLRQKLEEHCNKQKDIGRCRENHPEECSTESVGIQKGGLQLMSCQPPENENTFLKPIYKPQSCLLVKSGSDQVEQLTTSIQSLKVEQTQLYGRVVTLRKELRDVSLSVQTQTEEKQHLTRTIWALKEEKDGIARALDGLKQERDQIIRVVSGLKDVQVRLSKSVSGLKEKKLKLNESFPVLEREKEKLLESLSNGKEDIKQTAQTVQRLEREKEQLSQRVLALKLESEKLTESLQESTHKNQPCHHLQGDYEGLLESLNSLKDEKERTEHSVRCLKQEEAQTMKLLQSQKEQISSQQTGPHSHTQYNTSHQKKTKEENKLNGTNFVDSTMQEPSELVGEIEVVRGELKKSQEVEQRHAEITDWQTTEVRMQLSQSEVRRQSAERKASLAGDEVKRLTEFINQTDDICKENGHLTMQVKELQSKVSALVKEKAAITLLKSEIEDQHKILAAQLKAKTVALEELNLEYIALKKGRDNKDDMSALVSLRTRYNEVQAKYDALQKTKSQTDVDLVPLKAKLSCLVLKCQERNSFLAQVMKDLHRHSIVDFRLRQRADELLRDTVLIEYTAAFTPGSFAKGQDLGLTPGFLSKFHNYTSGHTQNDSYNDCRDQKGTKHPSLEESATNVPDCCCDVGCVPAVKRRCKNATSPVPTVENQVPPSSEHVNVVQSTERTIAKALSPPAAGPEKRALDIRPEACLGPSNVCDTSGSILNLAPPPLIGHASVSKRLSSPEKIINLQEQLQQTLLSRCKVVVGRGSVEQSRRRMSFSAPASPNLSSQKKLHGLDAIAPPSGPLSSTAKHPSLVTSPPVVKNQPTTPLFNAVTARCANMSFAPHLSANRHFKGDISITSPATNSMMITAASSQTNSTSSGDSNVPTSPKLKRQISPDEANAEHSTSSALMTSETTDSSVFVCSDANPKSTASDTSAPIEATAHKADVFSRVIKPNGADPSVCDGLEFTTCKSPSEGSSNKSHVAPEKLRSSRPKPDAPAEVRFVEVIKQVGQSGLLIGWERPPLDELGCSHGTFVYGYRVLVNGDFYKSVMSSACTKCVLENVELSSPVKIGIQTLGSNGLTSNSVHIVYLPPPRTGHL
ncbi:GRIP and coiled-coil domain-containing protein 2-like [Hippocampus comes]|uniref:GRIP and coiled-coil domain-containing protein 2-like n=1 Tax=Hippocampus comes TaxID=109280 RepID=UPI00094E1C09|nr:PREDICTED: GRIP and coiled-coil domain-containing protein 2-like [Hippocampus comes]